MTVQVRVAGEWLASRGNVSAVAWSSRWGTGPCGDDLASCLFAVDPDHDTSALRVGSSFQVWSEGVLRFGGVVDEVSREFPRSVSARGLARRAEDFEALDAGAPSSNPRAAVEDAIMRGLPWTGATALADVVLGASGDSVRRLDSLLTQWADATAQRWGVDSYGHVFATSDPTDADFLLDAANVDIGVTSDGLFTHVVARRVSAVTGDTPSAYDTETAEDATAEALYGRRELSLDLTSFGLLSDTTAQDYAEAHLALGLRPRWLQRVVVSQGQLFSPGGVAAHLPSVRAGQVVRLFNVPTNIGGTRYTAALDVVLGEVSYDTSDPARITLAPTNLAIRSLADALAQVRNR